MFWDAPPDYVPTEVDLDLAARWAASPEQIAAALARLAELSPRVEYVHVPIALPGKRRGFWTVGQPVEYPDGVFDDRDGAGRAAHEHLGERAGQVAYATVWRDGYAAVFEDFRSLYT